MFATARRHAHFGPCRPLREEWVHDDARVDLLTNDPERLGEILTDVWAESPLDTEALKEANAEMHTGIGMLMHPEAGDDTLLRAAKQMRDALAEICKQAIDARIADAVAARYAKLPTCCWEASE